MKNPFKLTLLLLALLLPATVIAHDFEVNGIYYNINGNEASVVKSPSSNQYSGDITIPATIVYAGTTYSVTAIADSAFYGNQNIHAVTLPETVMAIGNAAFKNCPNLRYLTLSSMTQPSINESFDMHCQRIPLEEFGIEGFSDWSEIDGIDPDFWLILFVPYEAYSNYKTSFFETQFFSYITSQEVTSAPDCDNTGNYDESYEDGFYVNFSPSEEGVVYTRRCDGYTYGGSGYFGEWSQETMVWIAPEFDCGSTFIDIQAFAISEGKSPSNVINYTYRFQPSPKPSYDFKDSGIFFKKLYNNINTVKVTYGAMTDPCGDLPIWTDYYSGDIAIPSVATDNRTSKSYTVTLIGNSAFADCEDLYGVTLPETITSVQEEAFYNCPSLTFIKCMGSIPPVASNYSFDDGVYRNATLYVPFGSEDDYRNADGWSNFLSIVGFSDIKLDLDGISYKVIGENTVIVISGEESYSGNVVIPETLTVDGVTYAVMGIGSGAFANDSLNFLTIPVNVTSNIASDAFESCFVPSVYIIGEGAWADGALPASVDTLYISSGVTGVEGLQVNPSVIYSYAAVPPTCDVNSFTGYDAELHVPASSLAAYFTEPYWSNFINIVSAAVEPTGLSLENDSISIMVGNQITLVATVIPDNATPQQVFWTSTNDCIAKVGPINGELTALKAGECDIKATLLDKTVVCHVTVTEIAPTEVTISQEFAKLEIGSLLTLTATVLPEDATDKVITWMTTNSEVATVDSLGNVMAVGPGECFITASCRDKQAMCHVIVVEHFIYITLDEHRLSLLPNHMEWLTPTVTAVSTDLVVTSSNPSVAAARMANGRIQVVGITEGTTIIKVNSVDGYAEADSCRVTVRTQRGDVNYDGFINITDVTMMISQLMSAQGEDYYDINADVNNDGEVNISDVTRLISHLMTGAELEPKDENPIVYETFTVNGVSFKMIKVEGGTFMMGATEEEDADYQVFKGSPKHQVTLSDYSIGETEVTQELWLAVMGSNPSANTGDLLRPVENVNWFDCDTFIMRLNALTGKEFRLPSEAEWEFAAHGGNLTQGYIYAGSDSIDEVAWYIANSDNVTHAVATKAPNELGIYDMNGNAEEWCNDWYYLYTEEPVTNPTGPETGRSRVHRGGRYSGAVKFCRITRRDGFSPGVRRTYMGLRLAM